MFRRAAIKQTTKMKKKPSTLSCFRYSFNIFDMTRHDYDGEDDPASLCFKLKALLQQKTMVMIFH